MAFKTDADSLRTEIRGSEEFRDKFLKTKEDLVNGYTGRYFRSDKQPDSPTAENHAYEYLSVMLPATVYDNPRCKVRAASPMEKDGMGMQTMGQRAEGIEIGLNRWAIMDDVSGPLSDVAHDFYFTYAVVMVTVQDQPGYRGAEMVPKKPYIMHLDQKHFVLDMEARTPHVMQHDGPRFCAHMWKADRDDLEKDASYDTAAVDALMADIDLDKYDPERRAGSGMDSPKRDEILAWDVWVPEHVSSDDPATNGTIFTVAVASKPDGTSKRAREIRKPRAAYCGPWGPYTVLGAYKVSNCPYPLGPLTACAEQAEALNAHTAAAAEEARAAKRIGVGRSVNASDAERVKSAPNGDIVLLDDPESIRELELGGVSESQYRYLQDLRERLERVSGMSAAKQGSPSASTATAESIADAALNTRHDGLKRQFRSGVSKIFRSAAWYMWYGDDVRIKLAAEGERKGLMEFRGGVYPGMEEWTFHDLTLTIDPLSLEHTDQAILQKRMQQAYELLIETAPLLVQFPYVHWREPIRALFEILNIGDADEWIDFDMAKQMSQQQQQQQQQQQPDDNAGPEIPAPPAPPAPGPAGTESGVGPDASTRAQYHQQELPAMSTGREYGAEVGAIASVA